MGRRVLKADLLATIQCMEHLAAMPFFVFTPLGEATARNNPGFISVEKYAHGPIQEGEFGRDGTHRYKIDTRRLYRNDAPA